MVKIIAVIQARMGSSRLQGKVLADIEGKPLIRHIYNRLQKIPSISQVVIVTTNESSDKPLRKFAKSEKIAYFAGSMNDIIASRIERELADNNIEKIVYYENLNLL